MSDKIKFSELVKSYAEANELTQQKAESLIRRVFNLLLEDLENEGKASITNFGSFELKEVTERNGVNPQTREEIVIPAHKKVSFKPYKALESTVNAPFAHLEAKLIEEEISDKESDKGEEITVVKAENEKKESDDPFESVTEPVEEKIATETQEEKEIPKEEESKTLPPPPIYKAENSDKGGSGSMWLVVILLLIVVGIGGWYFFLRDSGDENQIADNEPVTTQQETMPESEPPKVSVEPEVNTEAEEPTTPAEKNTSSNMETPAPTMKKETPQEMTSYIIKKDEWMWDISRKVYGKAYLWPLIFEANKNVNNNPNLVEPAKTLIIPALEGSASALTKTDYSNLAKASKMVSEAYANAGNQERSAEYLRFSKKYEQRSE